MHKFLIKADNVAYGQVQTNLLSQGSITLGQAYQTMVKEEHSKIIARGKEVHEEIHSFLLIQVNHYKPRYDKLDKSKLFCIHCKQRRHKKDECFKIYGYPEW